MESEDQSIADGLQASEEQLAKEHVEQLAQNVKQIATEKELVLKKQDSGSNQKLEDIDNKYKNLLSKINR